MSLWSKSGGSRVVARLTAAADSAQESRGNAGQYQLLYKFLRDRYANRVVLTFGEIEDLLGFPLPEPARSSREWWGDTDAAGCRAWRLASMTATVNLPAQSVLFERQA